nr:uncharacterized protein LOC112020638 [Quercus suber]
MTVRTSTGETPFKLAYGAEEVILAEVHMANHRVMTYQDKDNEEQLRLSLDLIDEVRTNVEQRIAKYKNLMARQHDAMVKPRRFNIRDLILKRVSLATKNPAHGKLGPNWEDGYKALGHVVTNSTQKPSPDKIRCVKAELTEQCEHYKWIWGAKGFNVYTTRPSNRGTQAMGVHLGSFVAQVGGIMSDIACLKNSKFDLFAMPTLDQLKPLIDAYALWVYFHPDEKYRPATVEWFFENEGLLYKKGDEANPVTILPDGSNLPQGGSDDNAYWLDVPPDSDARDKLEREDFAKAKVYVHVKPMFGATFTDIVIWMYYPFNGPATIKFRIFNIKFDHLGEHTGDWEHVTLRVNNFNGELQSIYLFEHRGGKWVDATDIEFQDHNKAAVYA